ncbi:MAG TPA: hypothetical protein VIL86_10850 [Tepidisphaeraceae bacterium]
MTEFQAGFLDVPSLLESSQPAARRGWLAYGVGLFLLVVLGSAILSARSTEMAAAVEALSSVAMVGLTVGMGVIMWKTVRRQRGELQQLEAVSELVQLRRWQEAAMLLQALLGAPMRSPAARIQALIYLTSVLARYHRFDDARAVQEYILEHVRLDPGTEHGLRLGRAMAMLREDHLFDADRAINELRRMDAAGDSAGLALIEIYRDVKTGHPNEAIELFSEKLDILRQGLGHRVGDAYVLIAKAHDLLGQTTQAAIVYEKATLLAPLSEMQRRYPEVAGLAEKYRPAGAPAEAA